MIFNFDFESSSKIEVEANKPLGGNWHVWGTGSALFFGREGSAANLFGYVGDMAVPVCYHDYNFLHKVFDEEARGCHQNGFKTRALTL